MHFLADDRALPALRQLAHLDWSGILNECYARTEIYNGFEFLVFMPFMIIRANGDWDIFADDLYPEGEDRSAVVGLTVGPLERYGGPQSLLPDQRFTPFLRAAHRKISLLVADDHPYPPLPANPTLRVLRGILLEAEGRQAAIYSAVGHQTQLTFDPCTIESLCQECDRVPLFDDALS